MEEKILQINDFIECFRELCNAYDLDYDSKSSRVGTWFDSKLGEMDKETFLELIKRAKQEDLKIKTGYLPAIGTLVRLYYDCNIIKFHPKNKADMENFHDSECVICNGTGYVSLQKGGYTYGGYCCTCIKGERRNQFTEIGRKLGFYTSWLEKGFLMIEEELPF